MADPLSAIISAIGSIFGPAVGNAMLPKPNSFTDASDSDIDPRNMMSGSLASIKDALSRVSSNMDKGVFLPSAYVQSPPSFSGGGLPMPFGSTGKDSALGFAGKEPGNREGRNPLFLTGPLSSSENKGKVVVGGPEQPRPKSLFNSDSNSLPFLQGDADSQNTDSANSETKGFPQLKVGGDHQQALAAFRMLGLNV